MSTSWKIILVHRQTGERKELGLTVVEKLQEKDVIWLAQLRHPDYTVEKVESA